MKLELKHLAGYLPYGLKYKCNGNIYYYEHCSTRDFDYENSKPILRPLSDLTKEIEVNGEKFVPIIVLAKMAYGNFSYTKVSFSENEYWIGVSFDSGNYGYSVNRGMIELSNRYDVMLKLLEWHFDIYGLIENGLAIDINTLNL
jgi:hypothetical protein